MSIKEPGIKDTEIRRREVIEYDLDTYRQLLSILNQVTSAKKSMSPNGSAYYLVAPFQGEYRCRISYIGDCLDWQIMTEPHNVYLDADEPKH